MGRNEGTAAQRREGIARGWEGKKLLRCLCQLHPETFRNFWTSGKIWRFSSPGICKIKTAWLFNGLCSRSATNYWMGITGRVCDSVSEDQTAFMVPVRRIYELSLGLLKPEFSQPIFFSKSRRKDNAFDTRTNCVGCLTVSIISLYSMDVRNLLQNSCARPVVWPKACSVKRFTTHLSLRLPVITISLT